MHWDDRDPVDSYPDDLEELTVGYMKELLIGTDYLL
jgi:hypothetical protein